MQELRKPEFDLIVVGAGIGGIILTKFAVEAGLRILTLEAAREIGGLWRDLPAWQDIQSRKEDWTMGSLPIVSEFQTDILENIRSWVSTFQLENKIKCNSRVTKTTPNSDGSWTVASGNCEYTARFLVLATGAHNVPSLPTVERSETDILEFHSMLLREPAVLRGKRVVVVGGGASAFDLIDLALEYEASEIHWVYRSLKWMVPTRGLKYFRTDIRALGYFQMLGAPLSDLNQRMNKYLNEKYAFFGLEAIRPDHPFDYSKEQIVPGRRRLIENFKRLKRHHSQIRSISKRTVTLENMETLNVDVILFGTGYKTDLSFTGLPSLKDVRSSEDLSKKCGGKFMSLDYPNLFFLGSTLDTVGSTPIMYAYLARTLVSHMRGQCIFPRKLVEGKLNYWDVPRFLASFDRRQYPKLFWKPCHLAAAWFRRKFPDRPHQIPKIR